MKDQRGAADHLFSLPFLLLLAVNTVASAGFYMTMPTLPKYAVFSGMSLTEAGVLTGLFSSAAIFARPFAGVLADRVNRKWVLLPMMAVMVIASFGYSITHAPVALYVCRVLHGIAFAGSSTVQLALTAGMIPDNRRGEGMGYMGMAQILAMSFAPSMGLWIADQWGYEAMFCASAAIVALAAFALLLLPTPQMQTRAHTRFRWGDLFAGELVLFALMGSLFSMSNGIVTSYVSMFADERAIANVGVFFTVSSVAVLLSKLVSGKLMDRRGLWFVMIPCFAFGSAAMFLIGGARALWPLLIAAALKGVAQSSGQSALQAECANRSHVLRTGVAMSTCYLGNDLGQGLGNALGGALSSSMGYAGMFAVVGAIMLTGFGMMALQMRFDRKNTKKTELSSYA
ncbi:MAG: MFS transporter [Oscillospiraceae bacterium]|jgi:predicted MFS family arabinose efflux permease|nr:MFS transporter [Oscillospiraceae bacterium]